VRLLEEQYVGNAARVGEFLRDKLEQLKNKDKVITDVRGSGLMIGVQVVTPALRDAIILECFRHGLLMLGAGASTIRLSPPLVIDEEQAEFATQILSSAISVLT
jgi:4-aminobutyrate aminotransferase-like enzyme